MCDSKACTQMSKVCINLAPVEMGRTQATCPYTPFRFSLMNVQKFRHTRSLIDDKILFAPPFLISSREKSTVTVQYNSDAVLSI